MQLKETWAGEVTIWLDEIAVTLGTTDGEEEAAQRKEREGTNHNTHIPRHSCESLPPFEVTMQVEYNVKQD